MGPFADDELDSVSKERVLFRTLRGPPVAGFLSVNDVSAKRPVLALTAPVRVGP